jgi:hypothetical protein
MRLSFAMLLDSTMGESDVSIPWILATLAIGFGLSYLAWKLPNGGDKK